MNTVFRYLAWIDVFPRCNAEENVTLNAKFKHVKVLHQMQRTEWISITVGLQQTSSGITVLWQTVSCVDVCNLLHWKYCSKYVAYSCNVVSLHSAVTHAILAYGCNETYCSILELFVYCHITNFITVVQRSVCLCVFFLFFKCNTTVIYAKLEDTATPYRCNKQCFKLLVFFRSFYSEREHVLKLRH